MVLKQNKFWVNQLADKIIERKKPPFRIGSGLTPSGRAHFGTLCEVLYPSKINERLLQRGFDSRFHVMVDMLDAFDSTPTAMNSKSKILVPHLGKPISRVPDPNGKIDSLGDHFLNEILLLAKIFFIKHELIRMDDVYASGSMDYYAGLFLENEKLTKEILKKTGGSGQAQDWSPILPICSHCGKISTTHIISHDTKNYEYVCDKDMGYIKGCGYSGRDSIHNHNYKLVWRLDWASRQDLYNVSCEGGEWTTSQEEGAGIL